MAKKKFYAVKFPDGQKELFADWPSCQNKVKGVSNAIFRGFPDRNSAREWLKGFDETNPGSGDIPQGPNQADIYVDGSFGPGSDRAGWGWVAVRNGEEIARDSGITKIPAQSRNIDGEVEATIQAMNWANQQGIQAVIVHDYAGISAWALGHWQAKSEQAKYYLAQIKEIKNKFTFRKVAGHSGDKWNDIADELAKEALVTSS